MVNRTPLLSRRTGAGHEVDCDIRLVPGFRFVEKLHACRLPWIRQLKVRDENDETFMIADFPGHRSCLIAFHPYRPGQVVTYNGGGSVATGSNAPPATRTVTVRSGDTLSGIAARLGIGYTQLTGYRSGNPNVLYPGEVLHY